MKVKIDFGSSGGFFAVLFLIFLVLKLTKVINWSWLWIFAPLWIPVGAGLLIVIVVLIIVLTIGSKKSKEV